MEDSKITAHRHFNTQSNEIEFNPSAGRYSDLGKDQLPLVVLLSPMLPFEDETDWYAEMLPFFESMQYRVMVLDTLSLFSATEALVAKQQITHSIEAKTQGQAFILVGQALGGAVAQNIAAACSQCRALISVSGPGWIDKDLADKLNRLKQILQQGHFHQAYQELYQWLPPEGEGGFNCPSFAEADAPQAVERLLKGINLLQQLDASEALPLFAQPAVCIVGERSQMVTSANQVKSDSPLHSIQVIPEAGMRLWCDYAEQELTRWVSALPDLRQKPIERQMKKVLVLPGDGIGIEVCQAAVAVFEQMGLPIALTYGDIGWQCWQQQGTTVPASTWRQIEAADAVLLGAITSQGKAAAEAALPKSLQGKDHPYVSPVILLRQRLGLFANIRPAQSMSGSGKPFRLCVIRENTEGLYAGHDYLGISRLQQTWLTHPNIEPYGPEQAAWTVRLQTRFGLERLFNHAFSYAEKHQYQRVTFADKPNVMRESGQFAADIFYQVAEQYPHIQADIHNVDAVALWLVKKPHTFGVIVAENMFGDILSDLAAGVMGGLGVAASANIGAKTAYFEPVHGSAPKMAGQNRANPSAMFLTIAMLLDYLGFSSQAQQIERSVKNVLQSRQVLSYDFGGNASTTAVAQAILADIAHPATTRRTTILTIGDELLSGGYLNENQTNISLVVQQAGYTVTHQEVCSDKQADIEAAVTRWVGDQDLLIIAGGLGPTEDDRTRFAVTQVAERTLYLHQKWWQHIQHRLQQLHVAVDPSDKKLALFPESANVIENPKGTAAGFSLQIGVTQVIVLPGPPLEAMATLHQAFATGALVSMPQPHYLYQWRLLGISESIVGSMMQTIVPQEGVDKHFLWQTPYVHVALITPEDEPLELSLLQRIDLAFAPYLVSKHHLVTDKDATHYRLPGASERLANAFPTIQWSSSDAALDEVCRDWQFTSTAPAATPLVVEIQLQPSLQQIQQAASAIEVQLTCTQQRGACRHQKFVCRAETAIEEIREYAAWVLIQMREQEKEEEAIC